MSAIGHLLEALMIPDPITAPLAVAIAFLAWFVLLFLIGRILLLPLVERVIDRRALDDHAGLLVLRISRAFIVFGAAVLAFGLAGLESFLLAFAGVAAAGTLALGFALQNVIRNFVAGLFIYLDRPFRVGDWIEWTDRAGIVEDIRVRTTRVRTFDNELLTVPNAELTDNVVKNPVAYDRIRQRFTVGVGFDDDISAATGCLVAEAEAHPEILDDPAPSVRLTELGDSAVLLQSRFWVADPNRADFVRIRGEYGQAVKERLDDAGIDIPFPIRTLDGEVTIADGVAD